MLGSLKQSASEISLERQIQELNLRLAAAEEGRKMSYIVGGILVFVKIIASKKK
jgi:hypothetical protein